jgi:uncharacterized Zn finger protein (UPF0148 family)
MFLAMTWVNMCTPSTRNRIAYTGVIVMHLATCPSCGTRVDVDFRPLAGLIWCPKCEKAFSPPTASGPKPEKNEQVDRSDKRDDKAG